jgi:hypothetical protein
MAKELVTMSRKEIDRVAVVRRVLESGLSQKKAGELARIIHEGARPKAGRGRTAAGARNWPADGSARG